jgi:PKD repeat protein
MRNWKLNFIIKRLCTLVFLSLSASMLFGYEISFAQSGSVLILAPADGATNVPVDTTVSATFSGVPNFTEFTVKYNNDLFPVAGTISGWGTPMVTFTPNNDLPYGEIFTVRILNITIAGVPLNGEDCDMDGSTDDLCWQFTSFYPAVSFEASTYQTSEDDGQVSLIITLNGGTSNSVLVDYVAVDISANHPDDYTPNAGSVTFQPFEIVQTIPFNIVDDTLIEGPEQFQVVLTQAQNASLGVAEAVVAIADNDFLPDVAFATSTASIDEAGGQVQLDLVLSQPGNMPVIVDYVTQDGSATYPSDYSDSGGSVTIPAGSTNHTMAIPIVNDFEVEGPENFQVILTGAQNATLGTPTTVDITIQDDDQPLAVTISPESVTVPIGEAVAFEATHQGGQPPFVYTWDFADGTSMVSPDLIQSHTYLAPGVYLATFNVADDTGQTATATSTVTAGNPPQASFLVDRTVVLTGETVIFTNTSVGDDPLTYNWDFGDGATSSAESPSHSYSAPGEYVVTLTVSNLFGSSSSTALITVEAHIISLAELIVTESVIIWPDILTGTARFEISGNVTLPSTHTDSSLSGPVTFTLQIDNQMDNDIVTLATSGNKSFFHESYEESVTGLEVRDIVIEWVTDSSAEFTVGGQFSLPPANPATQPPVANYGFSAPVLTNGLPQHIVDDIDVLHNVQGNVWQFGP